MQAEIYILDCFPFRPASAELQSITNRISAILGTDHRLAKLQRRLWHQWGHPQPYKSQQGAHMALLVAGLCDEVNIGQMVANQRTQKGDHVIRLWLERGAEVGRGLADALLHLHAEVDMELGKTVWQCVYHHRYKCTSVTDKTPC